MVETANIVSSIIALSVFCGRETASASSISGSSGYSAASMAMKS